MVVVCGGSVCGGGGGVCVRVCVGFIQDYNWESGVYSP